MQNIRVNRYAHPKSVGWAGWVEPEDKTWIVFVGLDGRPLVFLNRDPETGGVLPDDPEEREAHLAVLRAEKSKPGDGGHIGQRVGDVPADYGDALDPHEAHEVIHPLGVSGGGGDVQPRRK